MKLVIYVDVALKVIVFHTTPHQNPNTKLYETISNEWRKYSDPFPCITIRTLERRTSRVIFDCVRAVSCARNGACKNVPVYVCCCHIQSPIHWSIQAKNAVFYYIALLSAEMMFLFGNVCSTFPYFDSVFCLVTTSKRFGTALPHSANSQTHTQQHFNLIEFNAFGTVRKSLLSLYVRVRCCSYRFSQFFFHPKIVPKRWAHLHTSEWESTSQYGTCRCFRISISVSSKRIQWNEAKSFFENLLKWVWKSAQTMNESAKPLLTKTKQKSEHARCSNGVWTMEYGINLSRSDNVGLMNTSA